MVSQHEQVHPRFWSSNRVPVWQCNTSQLESRRHFCSAVSKTGHTQSKFNVCLPLQGTSIAIYGIFSWYNVGSLSATYSIDGTPYPSSISVTTSSPSYLNHEGEASNYLYFARDSLPSGTHTLLVNITEANNQTFMLDYITYKPAFDTLSSMPSGVGVSPKSSNTSTGTRESQSSVPTGAVVGGVIGGLALGVLLTVLVILLLRRRRDREQGYAFDMTPGDVGHPNCVSNFPLEFAHFLLIHLCF